MEEKRVREANKFFYFIDLTIFQFFNFKNLKTVFEKRVIKHALSKLETNKINHELNCNSNLILKMRA